MQKRVLENKAGIQRILYEESREKVRALEKVVKTREDEHSELVALRELLHVQNTNQVIENIYSVVKAEVE